MYTHIFVYACIITLHYYNTLYYTIICHTVVYCIILCYSMLYYIIGAAVLTCVVEVSDEDEALRKRCSGGTTRLTLLVKRRFLQKRRTMQQIQIAVLLDK